MNLRHIFASIQQEFFITKHSMEVFIDALIFPLINIVIFGLISLYLAGNDQRLAGEYVLLGMVFWQAVYLCSYSVGIGAMWNIWSRNLSNLFVAPLQVKEYVLGLFISSCIKSALLVLLGAVVSRWLFQFNMFEMGMVNFSLALLVLLLFGFALAVASLGFIFRFGTRLAALAWSVSYFFQPLSAAFFPIADLPQAMQWIAYLFPPTYAFEAMRAGLATHEVNWKLYSMGLGLDAIYVLIGVVIFQYLFARSKDTGQFARNEA